MPSNKTAEVKSIEMHHTSIHKQNRRQHRINVRGIAKTDVHRGDVAGPASNPPTVAKEFIGQIIVYPTTQPQSQQATPQYSTTTQAKLHAVSLKSSRRLTHATGQVTEEHPSFIKNW
jgi:elongation factor 1-alpha